MMLQNKMTWDQWIKQHLSPIAEPHVWKGDDLLTIMYTSGTTGKPKGVMHSVHPRSIERFQQGVLNWAFKCILFVFLLCP
jgi:acyl-coenzyme A synthetase/AMP-(fatty) acid ligase